jgi:hypothetical protein
MILEFKDFKCEAYIPSLLQQSDLASPMQEVEQEVVREYIEKFEPEWAGLFYKKWKDYEDMEAYSGKPEEERTDKSLNASLSAVREALSRFVAYNIFRAQINTPIGAVELGSDNGKRQSLVRTEVLIWNQMVDWTKEAFWRMYKTLEFPRWIKAYGEWSRNDIFWSINEHNL